MKNVRAVTGACPWVEFGTAAEALGDSSRAVGVAFAPTPNSFLKKDMSTIANLPATKANCAAWVALSLSQQAVIRAPPSTTRIKEEADYCKKFKTNHVTEATEEALQAAESTCK